MFQGVNFIFSAAKKPDDLRCLPDFAILCSFLTYFGSDLGIHLTFPQLYDFLCLQDSANTKIWETLHVKLLNKLKYRARPDRWEPVLGRFLLNHGLHIDGIETAADILLSTEYVNDDKANFISREPVGHLPSSYYRISPCIRTRTLLCLLESQFDRNQPFKDKANLRSPIDLRFPPLGIDVWGRSYWLLKDSDVNIYLYREDHHDNSFMLLCESFDEVRDLIEELKGAYSEDEKLEDILRKRQLSTDEADLKDQLTTLIQEGIASPENQKPENCENSDLSASTPDVGFKPAATPPPTPAFPHVPTLHSVDLLLATSKVQQFIKTEYRDNETEEEEKRSPEMVSTLQTDEKGDDKMEAQVNEAKQGDLHTSEEYHIKPECTEDGVLRPDDDGDDCNTKVTENPPQTSTIEESTCVMSNNKMKKSRKQNSNKNYPESSINEQQDLRRSSRQRKPVQVFTIEPVQPKRLKISSTPITESLSKSTNEVGDGGNSKKKKIPEDASAVAVTVKKKRKKKKRHRKKSRKRSNPWNNETSSSDSDVEEDDSFEKALMQHMDADSDDSISHSKAKANKRVSAEWSDAPESDFDPNGLDVLSDVDSVTDGRNLARQKRLQKKFISDTDNTLNEIEKEEPCQVCFKSHMPDWMLLCDRCDLGHHAMCLSPPLYIIPEGDWFCPRCQHTALISSLNETVTALEAESKKRNIWKRMQERLNFVNISMTNILGDDDSDCADGRKVKKGKVLRNIQSNNVNYAYDHSSSDRESKDANSDSNSDAESVEYNTDSGVDGRSQKPSARHPRLRQRRKIQYSTSRRVKFREETSDEDTESSESEAESIPCRTTRQRQVKYKLSDAFKQLDEALEADEKYQEEKQRRLKRKANQNLNESGGEAVDEECETNSHPPGRSRGKDLSNILGPEWKESEDRNRKRRRDKFSSSSSSEDSANEDKISGKNRKASDEDFNPSSSEEAESEDEADDYRRHHSSDEQLSSDNSWLCTARRSSRSSRKNTSKRRKLCNYPRRSRRPVPCFEDSDECSDRKATRSRRCTRNVVSYRESNDEESSDNNSNKSMQGTSSGVVTPNKSKQIRRVLDDDDDDEEDNGGDNITKKENNTTDNQPPSPITVSLKANRTHGNRKILKSSSSSSDSEYKPFDDDDDDGGDDGEEEEGDATASDDSDQFTKPNNLKSVAKSNKSNSLEIIKPELSDEINNNNNSDDHDHQLRSPELVISETSDIDNSLFKDHVVKSPTPVTVTTNSTNTTAIVSECYKTEETDENIKMINILSSSPKNYLNGQCNNLKTTTTIATVTPASNDDEEVEDEADECLPNRNFHVSHLFDKNTIDDDNDSKTCVSPDLF
ncbi:unnamed protein product [Trichobilharzia regenti]|nr:unnamed protein product [Trichobilharzia regenti]